MFKGNKYIRVRLLLLALFLSYYGNTTFFAHCHVINGVTIVHSHYFHHDSEKQNTSGKHSHTSNELTLIAHNAAFSALLPNATEVPQAGEKDLPLDYQHPVQSTLGNSIITPFLRGPPLI